MEFCPECGKVLFQKDVKFTFDACGYEKGVTEESKKQYEVAEKIDKEDTVIVTDGNVKTLPTIKVICPKCGNKLAFWWLQQTRSADESETRFFRCTECDFYFIEFD